MEQEKYVVSRSGHAASPEEIIASCNALHAHIRKVQEDAEQTIKEWEQSLRDQELAEKRRLAPGWLDREEKILEPNRTSQSSGLSPLDAPLANLNIMDQQDEQSTAGDKQDATANTGGDELDRAFGGMGIRNG